MALPDTTSYSLEASTTWIDLADEMSMVVGDTYRIDVFGGDLQWSKNRGTAPTGDAWHELPEFTHSKISERYKHATGKKMWVRSPSRDVSIRVTSIYS